MIRNVGGFDRALRLGIAGVALGMAVSGKKSMFRRILALTVAGSGLFTATTQYCPLSQAFGINTYGNPEERFRQELESSEAEMAGAGI